MQRAGFLPATALVLSGLSATANPVPIDQIQDTSETPPPDPMIAMEPVNATAPAREPRKAPKNKDARTARKLQSASEQVMARIDGLRVKVEAGEPLDAASYCALLDDEKRRNKAIREAVQDVLDVASGKFTGANLGDAIERLAEAMREADTKRLLIEGHPVYVGAGIFAHQTPEGLVLDASQLKEAMDGLSIAVESIRNSLNLFAIAVTEVPPEVWEDLEIVEESEMEPEGGDDGTG